MATVHAQESPSFPCDLCDQTFNRKDNLRRHVNRAHKQKEALYSCERCKKSFTREGNLRRHEQLFCNITKS